MPGRIMPLHYEITDWHQAIGARSNTDSTLRIKVTDFIHSEIFEGIRLQVRHPQYGILFSCIVNASGRLIAPDENAFLSTAQILIALRQLGFIIDFKEKPVLNQATREFLEGCLAAGYTHIRWALKERHRHHGDPPILVTPDHRDHKARRTDKRERIIICFNEEKRPSYCEQCIPPIRIFGGDVMQVSVNDNKDLDFSWLPINMPLHIQSLLSET